MTDSPRILTSASSTGALRLLRRLARTLRHAPDRLLHPFRRRALVNRLRRQGPPSGVLFVCHGNICRSPYAEAAFRAALPTWLRGMRIMSAGFIGAGRPVPPEALTVAARLGVDLGPHRSASLAPAAVGAARLIVVMDAAQRHEIVHRFRRPPEDVVVLGDLDPEPIDTRAIRDPVEQPIAVFEQSYARIDRCISQLIRAIAGRSSRASARV